MESIYLKTFIEVVGTGNLTRAAESLCVTQSAVSRRIKFLEDQYGCQLLDRSNPVLTPTAQGAMVVEKARRILEIESELLAGLTSLAPKKRLAFSCTATFGIVHLPAILQEFMLGCAEAGDLKFVFDMPDEILKNLRSGLFDIAVIEHCQCLDLSGFHTVSLPGDEMVFAAAPALGFGTGVVELTKVLEQTLFGRRDGCCSRTLLENNLTALQRTTSDFHRIIVYDDLHIIVQALIAGDGIGFVSSELVAPYVQAGQLTTFKVPGFNHQRCRTFVSNNDFPGCSLAGQFTERLLARFPQTIVN